MIRVVVVDDSATVRDLLVEILNSDSEIRVVGTAKDGLEGVALVQRIKPNVVTMDIQMPRLDGYSATKEIMITQPTPIVIVTGSAVATEVEVAMHALRAGALAVVQKPSGPQSAAFDTDAQKVLTTVKAMAQVKVVRHWRPAPAPEPARDAPLSSLRGKSEGGPGALAGTLRRRLVAIATSTGGPAALQGVLSRLPGTFPVPILVVQHISRGFSPGLAGWLNSVCSVRVRLAEQGEPLAPQRVYLAPDDQHLGVSSRNTIVLSSDPPVGGFRPAGSYLFDSVARVFGASAVGVILTGMGEDGVAGLRTLRQAGGWIIAQDEASCVVFGMPGAAVAAGLPNEVLPLDEIAPRLVQLTSSP